MTQIERYSQLMKVTINSVSARVEAHFGLDGSVLAGTIQASAPKVVTSYEIDSPDPEERVAAVLRNARNGCWVRAAVANPTPFEDAIRLNGKRFEIGD